MGKKKEIKKKEIKNEERAQGTKKTSFAGEKEDQIRKKKDGGDDDAKENQQAIDNLYDSIQNYVESERFRQEMNKQTKIKY